MIAFTTLSIPSDTGKEMYKRFGLSVGSTQTHLPNHPTVLFHNGSGIEQIGKRRLQERLQVSIQELNASSDDAL